MASHPSTTDDENRMLQIYRSLSQDSQTLLMAEGIRMRGTNSIPTEPASVTPDKEPRRKEKPPSDSDYESESEGTDDDEERSHDRNAGNTRPLCGHANNSLASKKQTPVDVLVHLQTYGLKNASLPALATGPDLNPRRVISFILQLHGHVIKETQLPQFFPGLFNDTANPNIHAIFRSLRERYGIDATIPNDLPNAIFTDTGLANTIHVFSYRVHPDKKNTTELYPEPYYSAQHDQFIVLHKGLLIPFHRVDYAWLLGSQFRTNINSSEELFTSYCFPRKSGRGIRKYKFTAVYAITLTPDNMTSANIPTNKKRSRP